MAISRRSRLGIIITLFIAVSAYIGTCVWLTVNQHNAIFGGNDTLVPLYGELNLQPQTVQVGKQEGVPVFAWVIRSLPRDSSANQWVLYFHGAEINVTSLQPTYWLMRRIGFNILALEYPGFGGKPGRPTERSVEREAQIAFDYLLKVFQVPPANIAIWGLSLGTGVAVDLASHVQAGALVLISPYTSIVEAGQRRYPFLPMSLLLSDRFESDRKMPDVHMPVFIHHTYEDEFFPIAMARRLSQLAPNPKHLDETHGRHAETPYSTWVALQQFLHASAGFHLQVPPACGTKDVPAIVCT